MDVIAQPFRPALECEAVCVLFHYMYRSWQLGVLFVFWIAQLTLIFVVVGGPDAIARLQVDAGQPTMARASLKCVFQDSTGRASSFRVLDLTTGMPLDMVQLSGRVCAGATAASGHASAIAEKLNLADGLPVEVFNDVAGGALAAWSPLGGTSRIAISRYFAETNPPLLTFALGHELGHVVLQHHAWTKLFQVLTIVVSTVSGFVLLCASIWIKKPVVARKLVATWVVVVSAAVCLLWMLSDKSRAYELEADSFGIFTLIESGLTPAEATGVVAKALDTWRDNSDTWWRGAGAHPSPSMRAERIRAVR